MGKKWNILISVFHVLQPGKVLAAIHRGKEKDRVPKNASSPYPDNHMYYELLHMQAPFYRF